VDTIPHGLNQTSGTLIAIQGRTDSLLKSWTTGFKKWLASEWKNDH